MGRFPRISEDAECSDAEDKPPLIGLDLEEIREWPSCPCPCSSDLKQCGERLRFVVVSSLLVDWIELGWTQLETFSLHNVMDFCGFDRRIVVTIEKESII